MAPPPDVTDREEGARVTLAEMSEEAVHDAIRTIKAAFLRFFVSMMVRYQDLIVVPPSDLRLPAALDFFDVPRWRQRFAGPCDEWLEMFARSQSFTQFLEARLAPRDAPELDVCFFNESIDAKLGRSVKTKFFAQHYTPLLSTGVMPAFGYSGVLVPPAARTVYNASMIAARPVQSQQQIGLLLVLGSGLQESEAALVAEFADTIKQEFARNLLWSRVNVDAALLVHVCTWTSAASRHHAPLRAHGLDQQPLRDAMLDLMCYSDEGYRSQVHATLRESLRELARDGGRDLPLCVVAHGFGSVLAVDCFAQLQRERPPNTTFAVDEQLSPLERGQTLAVMYTLGSPLPLITTSGVHEGGGGGGAAVPQLRVPAPRVVARWPHLRGGWSNFRHKGDPLGYALQQTQPEGVVAQEAECRQKPKAERKGDAPPPAQSAYFSDMVSCVGPIAQSLSWVWQDANRTVKRKS